MTSERQMPSPASDRAAGAEQEPPAVGSGEPATGRPDEGRPGQLEAAPAAPPSEPGGLLFAHVWSEHGMRLLHDVEEVRLALEDDGTRVWVDVESAPDAVLHRLGEVLGLHPLVAEDIIERNQRAKVEYTDLTLHMVIHALIYDERLETVEVDIVLGRRFLLTSHPPQWRPLKTLDLQLRGIEHFLSQGTDFLLYAVTDPIIDGYFPVIDRLSDEIDVLEDEVIRRPDKSVVERLFRVRRDLLRVRHALSPEREIFNQLTNREQPLIDPSRVIYFRDTYDHMVRITDELDTHRELVAGALDAYLSTINNNLSDVMKRLTSVTAILAGVGAVAGIFGMSEAATALDFREGPGFWAVTGMVVLVGVAVYAWLRHIDWI